MKPQSEGQAHTPLHLYAFVRCASRGLAENVPSDLRLNKVKTFDAWDSSFREDIDVVDIAFRFKELERGTLRGSHGPFRLPVLYGQY